MNIGMIAFLAILVVICIWGFGYFSGKDIYVNEPLAIEHIGALRGIMAVEIVLGHIYGNMDGSELLYVNSRIGIWPVGLFFFLSGYGLMVSLHKKQDYLKGFVKKRVVGIVLPFILVFVIWMLLDVLLFAAKQNVSIWGYVLHWLKSFGHYLYNDWFVCEMTLLYLIWFLLYKYLPEKWAFCILLILTIALNVTGCVFQMGSRWYGSTACFLLGIFLEKKENAILMFLKKHYWRNLLLMIAVFSGATIVFLCGNGNIAVNALAINVTCLNLCGIVYMFLMKCSLGNKVTNFWGSVSWEIYVVHRCCIYYIGSIPMKSTFLQMLLLMIAVWIFAYLLKRLSESIKKQFTGR